MSGKKDQSQPVTLAALHEVADYGFHDIDARGLTIADNHVLGFHRTRDIHRHHEITASRRQLNRVSQPLRAAGSQDQEQPYQGAADEVQQAAAGNTFIIRLQSAQRIEKRHIQGSVLARCPGKEVIYK